MIEDGGHGAAPARRRSAAQAIACMGVLVLTCVVPVVAGGISARQVTTNYVYNADGALTAIVTSGDGLQTQTTYLTWDDFIPDAADPRTGTTMIGNGTLAAVGPVPGAGGADQRFDFDARNRLLSYASNGATETYGYHAGRSLASSTLDDDSLRFYQNDDMHPQITNIYHSGTDRWDAYIDQGRYLSDGREEILLNPRKDMACTYDPRDQTLEPYVYDDAFGSQPTAQAQSSYDLEQNPFQYAGEYRDPIWGGIYLRARWYDPDLPLFISRDPMPYLNRYAYAGGNPAMRVDPDGMSFHSPGHYLRVANEAMNEGVQGHFARLLLTPVVGILQIAADPKGFWQQIKTNKDGIDIFLAVGVVTQIGWMGAEGYGLSSYFRNLALGTRVLTRLASDFAIGVGQSLAVGADRGFSHFNQGAFWESMEMTVGALGWERLGGRGYNPYTLTGEDVARRVGELQDGNTWLIFRQKVQAYNPFAYTSPLQEAKNLGLYHERLVAVSRDSMAWNELLKKGPKNKFSFVSGGEFVGNARRSVADVMREARKGRYQFVGTTTDLDRRAFERANPRGLLSSHDANVRTIKNDWTNIPQSARYGLIRNNCQDHCAAVLEQLEFQ